MARIFFLLIFLTALFTGCNTVEPQGGIPADVVTDTNSVEDSARRIIDRANEQFQKPSQPIPDSILYR